MPKPRDAHLRRIREEQQRKRDEPLGVTYDDVPDGDVWRRVFAELEKQRGVVKREG